MQTSIRTLLLPRSDPAGFGPGVTWRRGAWRAPEARFREMRPARRRSRLAPAGPARAQLPGNRFDDELDGLQPLAGLLVVEIAHANQALAEALTKLLGAALSRAERETRLHAG